MVVNANPNRSVAILTPLLFAPAAGAVSAAAAKYGLDVDGGQLQAIFIAGATIAFAKAGLWMKGWQDYEKREDLKQVDPLASVVDPDLDDPDEAHDLDEPDEAQAFDDLDRDEDLDGDFEAEAAELLAGTRG